MDLVRLLGNALAVGVLAIGGCGPAVGDDAADGSTTGTTREAETAGVDTSVGASSTANPTSPVSSPDTGSSDGGDATTSGTRGPEPAPFYAPCDFVDGACVDGLGCAAVDTRPFFGICTVQCFEPETDCEPPTEGWRAVCVGFLHDIGPDPFCAIGCNDDATCPEAMHCSGAELPYSPPAFCIPDAN